MAYMRLGDLLLSSGVISHEQLERALELQKESKERLGDVLVQSGIITEQQLKGNLPDLHAFPQSAVIGYVDLVDCTGEAVDSVWSAGSIADGNVNWVLKNAHIFNHALFPGFKAKLNLFEIPELDEDNLPPSKIIEL